VLVDRLGAQPPDQDEWRDYRRVRVINVRQRPIGVTQVGLRMRSLRALDSLPVPLKDGERATFYFEHERPQHDVAPPKVSGAWVEDSRDRIYVGRYRPNRPSALFSRFRWALYRRRRDRRGRRELRRRGVEPGGVNAARTGSRFLSTVITTVNDGT
jgi:hypothetical protein